MARTTTTAPRNKNHRIYWDTTLVKDPLEWVFDQFENRKLGPMIERAGYPGVAADLDVKKIDSVLPMVKEKAREMQACIIPKLRTRATSAAALSRSGHRVAERPLSIESDV